jgi:hypothetical protein
LTLPGGSYCTLRFYCVDTLGVSSITQSVTVQVLPQVILTGTLTGNLTNVGIAAYDFVKNVIYTGTISNGTNFSINISGLSGTNGYQIYTYFYFPMGTNNYLYYNFQNYYPGTPCSSNLGSFSDNTNNVNIIDNDSLNSNSSIYLYGTITGTNFGVYDTDSSGDVVAVPYQMSSLGNCQWSMNMNLVVGAKYIFKFNNTNNNITWLGSVNVMDTNTAPISLVYTNPSAHLSQDVTVLFSVCMSNTTGFSSVSVRGNSYPLNWNTSPYSALNDSGTNGDAAAGDNIWSGCITFTNGSPSYFEYKYILGSSGWENDIANRTFIIDSSLATNIIPMAYFDTNF